MRKVSLYIASTIDGKIAGKEGELGWLSKHNVDGDADYGYSEFIASVDTILMGRRTWDQVLSFGGTYPYPGTKGYVFSKEKRKSKIKAVKYIQDDAADFVRKLKEKSGITIWLVGGGVLASAMFKADLVDEIIVSIVPVLLGDGSPLFIDQPELWFDLTDTKTWPSGMVQLTYTRNRERERPASKHN